MFESLCKTDLINLDGTSCPLANIAQKALDVSNTIYLILKIILLTVLISFDLQNRTQKPRLPKMRTSRVRHFVRWARLFDLITCNACFVLSYLGFFPGFPSKMPHCVAFECGNQA